MYVDAELADTYIPASGELSLVDTVDAYRGVGWLLVIGEPSRAVLVRNGKCLEITLA